MHYVTADSANPLPPYTSWATAARAIQHAIDVAVAEDEIVVSNGVYASGQRAVYGNMASRVVVDKPLTVRSVDGPQFTVISGGGALRSVCLTNRATLSGFTLTNGVADNGGGLWCESTNAFVTNCVLVGNSASEGGGAYGGTLYNCTLTGNSASKAGGGTSR